MKFKPYQLVHVTMDNGRYSIIGEVMSFPIPHQHATLTTKHSGKDTIMVRMVPNHPGTLQEIEVTRCRPVEGRKRYAVCYATVKGHGSFPDDMLRYDHAVPVNFTIDHDHFTGPKAVLLPDYGDELLIATVEETYKTHRAFCAERWASFLWAVKPLKVEYIAGSAS
jgi:hypothetical protein